MQRWHFDDAIDPRRDQGRAPQVDRRECEKRFLRLAGSNARDGAAGARRDLEHVPDRRTLRNRGFARSKMTKGTVRLLSYARASELGPPDICENNVTPGIMRVQTNAAVDQMIDTTTGEGHLETTPTSRRGAPSKVADACICSIGHGKICHRNLTDRRLRPSAGTTQSGRGPKLPLGRCASSPAQGRNVAGHADERPRASGQCHAKVLISCHFCKVAFRWVMWLAPWRHGGPRSANRKRHV